MLALVQPWNPKRKTVAGCGVVGCTGPRVCVRVCVWWSYAYAGADLLVTTGRPSLPPSS